MEGREPQENPSPQQCQLLNNSIQNHAFNVNVSVIKIVKRTIVINIKLGLKCNFIHKFYKAERSKMLGGRLFFNSGVLFSLQSWAGLKRLQIKCNNNETFLLTPLAIVVLLIPRSPAVLIRWTAVTCRWDAFLLLPRRLEAHIITVIIVRI